MCSPEYRRPFPLYGSGLRSLRMLAATSPTCCLSIPSTTSLVGDSTRSVIPSGGLTGIGWLKPRENSRFAPLAWTREPTPTISSVLRYPSVTPVTMFATSVLDRPCSARTLPSSLGLVTVMTPSCCDTSIGSATSTESFPLGPVTVTSRPLMVTSTPLGIVTGMRPIRDSAASSPDVGQDCPARATPDGLLVGHQATRGGDDGDAEPAEHPRQAVLLRVHPQPGLGHPLEARDRPLTGRPVLEQDHEVLADLGIFHPPAGDVALLLEDLRDVNLDRGGRHAHRVVVCRVGVAQTGQHVCDRVGHRHGLVALLTAVSLGTCGVFGRCPGCAPGRVVPAVCVVGYQLDLVMPGSSPRWAMDRKQIRQSPNLRYTARGRPHRVHRVYPRTLNFGLRFALTISAFFATVQFSLNGNPSRRSSERPSASVVAVVTTVTSIPRWRSTWSGLISWNI